MTNDWIAHPIASAVLPIDARPVTVIGSPSSARLSTIKRLIELAHYRDLLYTLTVHRIKVRYKQSILGMSWAIIQPVSMTIAFTAVFSLIARMPSGGRPYAVFAYVALLPWNFFSSSVTNATGGGVRHPQRISKGNLPPAVFP